MANQINTVVPALAALDSFVRKRTERNVMADMAANFSERIGGASSEKDLNKVMMEMNSNILQETYITPTQQNQLQNTLRVAGGDRSRALSISRAETNAEALGVAQKTLMGDRTYSVSGQEKSYTDIEAIVSGATTDPVLRQTLMATYTDPRNLIKDKTTYGYDVKNQSYYQTKTRYDAQGNIFGSIRQNLGPDGLAEDFKTQTENKLIVEQRKRDESFEDYSKRVDIQLGKQLQFADIKQKQDLKNYAQKLKLKAEIGGGTSADLAEVAKLGALAKSSQSRAYQKYGNLLTDIKSLSGGKFDIEDFQSTDFGSKGKWLDNRNTAGIFKEVLAKEPGMMDFIRANPSLMKTFNDAIAAEGLEGQANVRLGSRGVSLDTAISAAQYYQSVDVQTGEDKELQDSVEAFVDSKALWTKEDASGNKKLDNFFMDKN